MGENNRGMCWRGMLWGRIIEGGDGGVCYEERRILEGGDGGVCYGENRMWDYME